MLDILVKAKGARVKEVPYAFANRAAAASNLDSTVMFDYIRAVWKLYRHGRSVAQGEKRASVRLSKAGRFYTAGATGLLVKYLASLLFNVFVPELWFQYATVISSVFHDVQLYPQQDVDV